MILTLANFKANLIQKLSTDQDVNVPLDATFDSAFCQRTRTYLEDFSRETLAFFKSRSVLTVPTASPLVDLYAATADMVFYPWKVWVANLLLCQESPADMETKYNSFGAPLAAGIPRAWCSDREGQIRFEKVAAAAYANSYVSGWAEMPAAVAGWADNSHHGLPLNVMQVALEYCAATFMREVSDEAIGLTRLKMHNRSAYDEAMRFRARNLAVHLG